MKKNVLYISFFLLIVLLIVVLNDAIKKRNIIIELKKTINSLENVINGESEKTISIYNLEIKQHKAVERLIRENQELQFITYKNKTFLNKFTGLDYLENIEYIFFKNGYCIKNQKYFFAISLPYLIVDNSFSGIQKVIFNPNERLFYISYIGLNNDTKYLYLSSYDPLNNQVLDTFQIESMNNIEGAEYGGGMAIKDNNIYLSVGVNGSAKVDDKALDAQNLNNLRGKIIEIDLVKSRLRKKLIYKIYSIGHKQSQGLIFVNNTLFSVEHSLNGGDEINIINERSNYGYPYYGHTFFYDQNKNKVLLNKKEKFFQEPFYYFEKEQALSDISTFPNLVYYESSIMVSSLATNKIYVINLNTLGKDQNIFLSNITDIHLGFRPRIIRNNQNKNNISVLSDDLKFYEITFKSMKENNQQY